MGRYPESEEHDILTLRNEDRKEGQNIKNSLQALQAAPYLYLCVPSMVFALESCTSDDINLESNISRTPQICIPNH